MRYIAFEGTYNEQIWDSKTQTVIWPVNPELKVEQVKPVLSRKTWKRVPNNALAPDCEKAQHEDRG